MFGHCIRVYYKDAFDKHDALLQRINANPRNGFGSMMETIRNKLSPEEAQQVISDFEDCYENQPWLAMVDSDKGITNLHAPNDIIIDASMPVVYVSCDFLVSRSYLHFRLAWAHMLFSSHFYS
jgi:isocitrate dehydrogenase